MFSKNFLNDICNIPEETLTIIKTKLCPSYEKHYNKKYTWELKKSHLKLLKSISIIVLKHDKGIAIVTMNRTKCLNKFYTIWDSNQFPKLDEDPTCYMENNVQGTLRKVKSTVPQNVFSKIYPSGLGPGNAREISCI